MNNASQKLWVILRANSNLAIFSIVYSAFYIDIDTKYYSLFAKKFPPKLQRATFKDTNFQHFYFCSDIF